MLSFLKNNSPKKSENKFNNLRDKILININNQWILQDKVISRAFFTLLDNLTTEQNTQLMTENQIIIIPASGEYSCLIHQPPHANVILLFPEIIKLLGNVDNDRGLSILAHEFGHIYHQHYKKKISPLDAQIEADDFALQAGFGHGLVEVLLGYSDIDSQTRVSVLTSKILSQS